MKMIELANGYQIPPICYGTDMVSYDFFCRNELRGFLKRIKNSIYIDKRHLYIKHRGIINCTNHAIQNGCNFFDTSRAYMASEKMLGKALKNVKREDYFICTKLCNYHQLNNKPARDCLIESMEQLGVDYVDLYLLHWPVTEKYIDYWRQIEELYTEGLVKAIGVSNCKIHHLKEIMEIAKIIPMINEVELHPLLSEIELREFCKHYKIQIMAYTSTARMDFRLKNSGRMQKICEETGKDMAQVILRWHIQNSVIPIFNSSNLKHMISNMDVFDFELNEQQMSIIEGMNINARKRYDSDNCEWDRL